MEFSLYLTESVFGEIASFMLGALILFFMIYTTPRKSRGYQYLLWGMILSVMGSLLLTLLALPWSEMPTLGSSWFQAISMCCFRTNNTMIIINGIIFSNSILFPLFKNQLFYFAI